MIEILHALIWIVAIVIGLPIAVATLIGIIAFLYVIIEAKSTK